MNVLIFDLDGTLVDSRADLATGVNLLRADLGGQPLQLSTVSSFVGDGIFKLVERATADLACAPEPAELVAGMKRHYMAHMLDQTVPYAGVEAALEQFAAQGYELAVVTNKPEAPARAILEHLGMLERFACVLGGDSCPTFKPDPGPLLEVMEQTGAGVDGSWMIGDHYTDLAAGRAAGLRCCYCRYGFGNPRGEDCTVAVDQLGGLLAHL